MNAIGLEGCAALCGSLHKNTALQSMHLSMNQVDVKAPGQE